MNDGVVMRSGVYWMVSRAPRTAVARVVQEIREARRVWKGVPPQAVYQRFNEVFGCDRTVLTEPAHLSTTPAPWEHRWPLPARHTGQKSKLKARARR